MGATAPDPMREQKGPLGRSDTTAGSAVPRRQASARLVCALLVCLSVLGLTRRAEAHELGLSTGIYAATPQGVDVQLSLQELEAAGLEPELDADGDGKVAEPELVRARAALLGAVQEGVRVTRAGAACKPSGASVAREAPDGLQWSVHYECAGGTKPAQVRLPLLKRLSHGHRHWAEVREGSGTRSELLHAGQLGFSILPGEGVAGSRVATAVPWSGFLRMGVEHVVFGFDHLAFLVLLALSTPALRSLLGLTLAFTVAHSVSLVSTALGGPAPPSSWVEPLIALSIAYVAIENLLRLKPKRRWLLVFVFGLVHGFGFAGALSEVIALEGLLPLSLLSFNVGVELGQVAVLGLVVVGLRQFRRLQGQGASIVRVLNALGLLLGLFWTAERVYGTLGERAVSGLGAEAQGPPKAAAKAVKALEVAVDPRASQLCEVLHRLPGKRTAECCGGAPSELLFKRCLGVVGKALRSQSVDLNADSVAACAAAIEQKLQGCDWVRPGMPLPPPECQGLFVGKRKQGESCDSSLECVGSLHCARSRGRRGKSCVAPAANGTPCGGTADSMAAVLMDRDAERLHPECRGMCSRLTHQCRDLPELGSRCGAHVQCGAGRRCLQRKCQLGEPEPQQRLDTGEACDSDLDCRVGGCTLSDTGGRVCGKRCAADVLHEYMEKTHGSPRTPRGERD